MSSSAVPVKPVSSIAPFAGTIALVGSSVDQAAYTAIQLAAQDASIQTGSTSPKLNYRPPYHITLLSKDELRKLGGKEKVLKLIQPDLPTDSSSDNSTTQFFPLGLAGSTKKGIYFVVVIWGYGLRLRRKLGLGPKWFHITLSEKDEHPVEGVEGGLDRSLTSILQWFGGMGTVERCLNWDASPPVQVKPVFESSTRATITTLSPVLLDDLILTLHGHAPANASPNPLLLRLSLALIQESPASAKGFLRLADTALASQKWKLAMLAYGASYERTVHRDRHIERAQANGELGGQVEDQEAPNHTKDAKVTAYTLKKMLQCAEHTEWGHLFPEHNIEEFREDVAGFDDVLTAASCRPSVSRLLLEPWSKELRDAAGDAVRASPPSLTLEPRESLYIPIPISTPAPSSSRLAPSHASGSTSSNPSSSSASTSTPNRPRPICGHSFYKLPRFFRWLIPFYFAIMSTPRHGEDIKALRGDVLGIRKVLTLTEETPLDPAWFEEANKQARAMQRTEATSAAGPGSTTSRATPGVVPPRRTTRSGTPGEELRTITNTYVPVPNYHPPSIEQMDMIIELFGTPFDQNPDTNVPLLVHCGGGKGRAGTVAACYMIAFGFGKASSALTTDPDEELLPQYSAPDAISLLRTLRPGSIETSHQEAFISSWCSTLWKRRSVYPSRPPEPPPCPLEVECARGEVWSPRDYELIVLVGLPGSGKTWFAESLLARNPRGWSRISQDDSGSRESCETAIGRKPIVVQGGGGRGRQRVLLDRCNASKKDRERWLSLASVWMEKGAMAVYFDYDKDVCEARAQRRMGHPTLRPGGRVRSAIKQMHEMMERPSVEGEGLKAVCVVKSFEAAEELVEKLSFGTGTTGGAGAGASSGQGLFKFVRTPHLLDLGAVGDDDIVVSGGDRGSSAGFSLASLAAGATPQPQSSADQHPTKIVITEKIDGANLGFSLSPTAKDPNTGHPQILIQNRSHYVTHLSHAQFRPLLTWVERHTDALLDILWRDPLYVGRFVLFGEWMYATHSIEYDALPDWFVAFDLYDRREEKFVGRREAEEWLRGSGISLVPVMYEGVVGESAGGVGQWEGGAVPDEEGLKKMIQQPSSFCRDGRRVEGVYVKVEKAGYVIGRGKVVRGDFIAGNEHWGKGVMKTNKLRVPVGMDETV